MSGHQEANGARDMKAMLVMVHGSPREESNEAVRSVVELVRASRLFEHIEIGYLDVNQPDIPSAIDALVATGASEIVAVPYFLHTGKHVTSDLPDVLDAASQRHPSISIRMTDYLGKSRVIADILRDRARAAS